MKPIQLFKLFAVMLMAVVMTPVHAADPHAAVQRALGHISLFPGSTFHGPDHSYEVKDVILDADGTEHVRFDRRYKGLQVIGGDLVVHTSRSGQFIKASLTIGRWIDLPVKPSIVPRLAAQAALSRHPGDTNNKPPTLVIYARGELPTLAWDVNVFGSQADGTPMEKHVIVDAHGGQVLDAWDDIHTGSASGIGYGFFSGQVGLNTDQLSSGYVLRDPSRGNQYTIDLGNKTAGSASIFQDADNTWGDSTLKDKATVAVDAQYGTAVTWDYFKNIHGRNGIGNDGKGAYNRVHYGRAYNNAFWSNSCFCMTYGDGDGTTFNPFVALDVAGHEMTHGITSRTANLTYSGESGGLNEATSDIFGTMVEFYASNANDLPDYLIGEKLYKSGGRALRSMLRPSADGASSDCWYSGVGSLDVHYSSGVANHFFYLLAEGTSSTLVTSPTCKAGDTKTATDSTSLTGIGRDIAAKIWYRALTVYMTSNTNYSGAKLATINAAQDLLKDPYLYPSSIVDSVKAAWNAVLVP